MLIPVLIFTGCQVKKMPAKPSLVDVRSALKIELVNGDSMDWNQLIEHIVDMDVILIGEEHDDATGHAVQLAVVEDVFSRRDGGTLAMEMLERDEQLLIDDHADGVIDAKTFAKETGSTSWSGEGSWEAWYQPIVDAAHSNGAKVIGANAPRRYVRLARTDGWERLEEMSEDRQVLFSIPEPPIDGVYRERFFEIMSPTDNDGMVESGIDPSIVESFYRAQQVWDSTMAESVAEAVQQKSLPVILMAGRFHIDHEGGTVSELRKRLPDDRIVTITLDSGRDDVVLTKSENGVADIVIHTDN